MKTPRAAIVGAMITAAHPALAQERTSVADLLNAVTSGETTAAEVVDQALAAAETWRDLNAVATLNAEAARAAAATATGPLAGLPIVVKDNIRVAGLPAAAGTPGLMTDVASSHAPIVEALIAAGAVVIATANMHELAFGISGWNPAYQTGPEPGVRNAYDPTRFAGGSSSGTGALVGAGVVPAGLGTDTGGSVRIPAALNGVVGLRPSLGRYPTEGVVPISPTRDTPGFIAATVGDVAMLDAVVTGEAAIEPADLSTVRLGLAPAFTAPLGAEVEAVWTATLDALSQTGVTFVEVDASEIVDLNAQVSFPIALYEANGALEQYLEAHETGLTIEDVVAAVVSPDVKFTYETFVLPEKLPAPDGSLVDAEPIYTAAMEEGRPALRAAYERLFQDAQIDALFFPTTPQVAAEATPQSSAPEVFGAFIRNTDPGSNAALPGLTLPAGRGADTGLPVGVELDGPPGSDRGLLAIGLTMEAILGTLPPPEVPK